MTDEPTLTERMRKPRKVQEKRGGNPHPSAPWTPEATALGHIASQQAKEQRQREVLAAYAARPVRQTLVKFRTNNDISLRAWYTWMQEDFFRDELRKANEARISCGLDVFRARIEEVNDVLVNDAINAATAADRTRAARVIHEVLHTIRPNNKFQVFQNQAINTFVDKSDTDLVAQRDEILRLLNEAGSDEPNANTE